MIISALPIWLVDMAGAVLMIVFSFLSISHAIKLNRQNPNNLIWTYLLWVCCCLAGFAISRSAGHILKQVLIISDNSNIWDIIRPFSGSINTFLLIIVSSFTLFFERVWQVYNEILKDRKALESAHSELLDLNQNLENRVIERTKALARSEKQIAQADKLASIGQLSSGIAHEINNPLGIILGYTQLMLRNEHPETQKYDDLKTIEKHVKACKSIVEDLLNFARTSNPKKEKVCIHEIIEEALAFIREKSLPDTIEILKNYQEKISRILMDTKNIKQVIINLLINAIHAVGNKGQISISTQLDMMENAVLIKIEDSGHGISKKNLSRIFDPFFTTKPMGQGTGLGLAVSYGIIKNHGGDIIVESEPGKGSVFIIVLPIIGTQGRHGQ